MMQLNFVSNLRKRKDPGLEVFITYRGTVGVCLSEAGTTTDYSWGDIISSNTQIMRKWIKQTVEVVHTPNPGAFMICTAMCWNGQRIGTQTTVLEHRLILRVRLLAPAVSLGAAPGAIPRCPAFGLPLRLHPQHPRQQLRLPCRFPTAVSK